jgi:hypothetical protein
MSKEIEEITIREAIEILALSPYVDEQSRDAAKTVCIKVTQLLSSLEATQLELKQADQLREIRDGQLEQLKGELEKEKEQTKYWVKYFEVAIENKSREQEARIKAEERVKGLEAKIAIYLQDIKHEQTLSRELNDHLQKLKGALEKHKGINEKLISQTFLVRRESDEELYKVLEEGKRGK